MASHKNKISLLAALLININIIIGAGIFLNIRPLTLTTGNYGFLAYFTAAIILLPFVYVLARLAQANPVPGGLYFYSKTYLNPSVGFISGWLYFIGKTVSAAFLAHAFASFFQQNIVFLQSFPPLLLSFTVIFFLICLNIFGIQIGGSVQFLFFSIKTIPIFFAIIFGVLYFQPTTFFTPSFQSFFSVVPLALYPLMGFEITCSIGHLLHKPEKNIFIAIVGSFLFVACLYLLFQSIVIGVLGKDIFLSGEPLTLFANKIFAQQIIGKIITAFIFTSVIAGSFGILTSNCWNLQVLAQEKHLPGSTILAKISPRQVPIASLLVEGGIACLLLAISENQIALQSMSVFSVVCAFILSAFAAYKATKPPLPSSKKEKLIMTPLLPMIAIISCIYILYLCFNKITEAGISVPYLLLLLSGILIFFIKKNKKIS